jgi:hypothetical protein
MNRQESKAKLYNELKNIVLDYCFKDDNFDYDKYCDFYDVTISLVMSQFIQFIMKSRKHIISKKECKSIVRDFFNRYIDGITDDLYDAVKKDKKGRDV